MATKQPKKPESGAPGLPAGTTPLNLPPGLLNDINPSFIGSANLLNGFAPDPQVLRRYVFEKAQEVDALSGVDYLQGVILRVETTEGLAADATLAAIRKTFAIESEEQPKLLRARVRIPELHVMLPVPTEKGHDQYPKKKKPVDDIIDLYPLCEAHDLPDVGFNVGDIVVIGFHNKHNTANAPRILSKVGAAPVPDFPGIVCTMQNQYSALSGQVDALNTNKQLLSGHTGTTQDSKRARTNNAAALVVSDKYFMKGALHKLIQEELKSRGYIIPDNHLEIIEDAPLTTHIGSVEGTLLEKKEAGGLHTIIYQFDEIFTPDVEDFTSSAIERNQVMKVLSAFVSKVATAAAPVQIILIGTTKTQMRKFSQPGNALIESIMEDPEFHNGLGAGVSNKLIFINPLDSVYTPGQNLEDRSGLWTAAAYPTNGPFPKAAMLKIVNQIKKVTAASPPVENKKPAPPEVSKKQPKMPDGYNVPDSLKMLLEERTFMDKNEAVQFLKSIAVQLGWEAATDEPVKLTVMGVAGSQAHWKDLVTKKPDEILTEENIALILGLVQSLDEQTFVAMKKSIEYKIGAAKDIYSGKAPSQDPPPASQPSSGPPLQICNPGTMPPGFNLGAFPIRRPPLGPGQIKESQLSGIAYVDYGLRVGGPLRTASYILVHESVTSSAKRALEVLKSKGLSVHFTVSRGGKIEQHAPLELGTRHAGALNRDSISVEIINPSKFGAPSKKYKAGSVSQFEAAYFLCKRIAGATTVPLSYPSVFSGGIYAFGKIDTKPGIISHGSYRGTDHSDGSAVVLYMALRARGLKKAVAYKAMMEALTLAQTNPKYRYRTPVAALGAPMPPDAAVAALTGGSMPSAEEAASAGFGLGAVTGLFGAS